ncbi:microtubule associated protein-domain-containing protein [Gymnopilus junonius]|uniref:Microtubule associated protein-domain-containing protein n=1 Tax=Gymnopilus junonius TaxID=109634 RepID=A0A9P5NPX3_GYMJU|nr:microtubule associated protein-domain-containing protein [Gymnopilus junonius]
MRYTRSHAAAPTLHAQLGLPPSALEDELKALQEQLVQSVELQIDRRRKEVETWMQKCDELEKHCLRYTQALGGNIKATGTSLGELRKEQALPRRYERISEHQEKLRQVYHTKLEQLNTITNRINTLARTLGSDYFSRDILEQTPAPEEREHDSSANRDVTPERFMRLEKELVRGKAEVNKRLNQLSSTFIQIDWLYTELGMGPPTPDDPMSPPAFRASSSLMQSTTSTTSAATLTNDPFLQSTPTPTSRSSSSTMLFREDVSANPEYEHLQIFANFVAKVEEADSETRPQGQNIPIGLEGVEPTHELLSWGASLLSSLEDIKRGREAHIQAMYDQLEGLWRRMGVADVDMDAFVETHRGSTLETVQEYEEELERMLELKMERMSTFVENAREEIVKLWNDLMVGEEERADFAPFADGRRHKAPLLASIKKYFEICEEEKELAAAASDQTRLTGRGSRDPGRLLREEKMRKRVSKEKPRLEQDLLVSIPAWEEETGRPFLVHGESILQMLMEVVSAADQENKRKQPRAGSVPPRATTPVNSAKGYIPGVKTGVVTPAVRTSSQMASQSVPNKRQRLGDGSSSGATPGYSSTARAPLGTHRGGNIATGIARASSPTKIPTKTPGSGHRSGSATLAMVIPKPGTQHHFLGHGRVPSTVIYGAGVAGVNSYRSTSSSGGHGRVPSAGYTKGAGQTGVVKKATRVRRESFKPRPSVDNMDLGVSVGASGGRWGGGYTVKEEDEY